jgi:hypothetical protein
MISPLLSQIGWYGLDRLFVLEMDLNGRVHDMALLGRKKNQLSLLRYWSEGTDWKKFCRPTACPS